MKNEVETAKKTGGDNKITWVFDKSGSIMRMGGEAGREKPFSFKLERYKDRETHLESMQITNYIGEEENGTIYTSIDRLDKDIFLFKKYGVVIGDTYFRDLEREIQKSYLDIRLNTVELGKDKRLADLINLVREYVSKDDKLVDKELCYVPVVEFDELAADCGFMSLEVQALRKRLKDDGFIYCAEKRYTMLKRFKGRTERVIAFYKSKIGIESMETVQEDSAGGT